MTKYQKQIDSETSRMYIVLRKQNKMTNKQSNSKYSLFNLFLNIKQILLRKQNKMINNQKQNYQPDNDWKTKETIGSKHGSLRKSCQENMTNPQTKITNDKQLKRNMFH